MSKEEISFHPLANYKPGILTTLLHESYAPLKEMDFEYWIKYEKSWDVFDNDAFTHADSIGKSVFITTLDNTPIGLGSFDPRQRPKGIIGHNCIIIAYQGRGFGQEQILELLSILKNKQCTSVEVSTSNHPFFVPVQQMYTSCGFIEFNNNKKDKYFPKYSIIEYKKSL